MKPITYYRLTRSVRHPNSERISTAAVLSCSTCGEVIDGMGGGETVVCERCYGVMQSGQARGCIKWAPLGAAIDGRLTSDPWVRDQQRRQAFIGETLASVGWLRRKTIIDRFRVSVAQASADIKRWMKENPGAARYDASRKAYFAVKDGAKQEVKP